MTVRLLSPRELADALGVSESSLKRWIDSGRITAARTEGGHRRIAVPEAIRFIRATNAPIVRPELLDLPEVAVATERGADPDAFYSSLIRGDALGARAFVMARYLSGTSIAELGDGPIRDAMHRIGELWTHDKDGVMVEHRATDTCLVALARLRSMIEPPVSAHVAVGATPEDDPYILPSFIAAMVVSAEGLRAVNLGPDTPVAALARAVALHRPVLVWISASATIPAARARAIDRFLSSLPDGTRAVVGGRRSGNLSGVRHLETMAELATVARELARLA